MPTHRPQVGPFLSLYCRVNGSTVVSQSMSADGFRVWVRTSPGPVNSNTSPSPLFIDAIVPATRRVDIWTVSS